jgi:transcriptional regulator with XRE-family HTH domain
MTPDALRRFREKQGLTQAQMADLLDYTRSYYNEIENGAKPLSYRAGLLVEGMRMSPAFCERVLRGAGFK